MADLDETGAGKPAASVPVPRDLYVQVARLHAAAIDQGFLASLGERFLTLLYQAIDECPEAVLLTEVEDTRVLGFVTGAARMRPIYRHMLRASPRLIAALAPVALNPRKLWKILEVLRHSGRADLARTAMPQDLPSFELLSLAVAEDAQRRGVARRLYRGLLDHSRQSGTPGFRIVVGDELASAHRFYTEMGATPVGKTSVHGAQPSTLYVQSV